MPDLLLGPLLRYVSETEATIWVETSERLRGRGAGAPRADLRRRRPPLRAGPRRGARAGGFYEYEVALDGEQRWPPPDSDLPPSAIRTFEPGKPLDVCFGSCRVAAPPRGALHEDQGRRRRRATSSTRSASSPGRWSATTATSGRSCSSCSATRSTSTRARRRPASASAPSATRAEPPGEEVDRLRGVHLALPRVLAGPADPLALLDRLHLDGLGRPRHERRLEHLRAPGTTRWTARSGGTSAPSAGS